MTPDAPTPLDQLPPEAVASPLEPTASSSAAPAAATGLGKRVVRLLFWPLLRVLEPRFADTNRRVDDTRRSLHEESNLTRWVLTRDQGTVNGRLDDYGAAHVEALTFVGTQLRELQDEVRGLHETIAALEARLPRDEPPAS